MRYILAFDTVSTNCAVCLWVDGKIHKILIEKPSEQLFITIQSLLQKSGLEIKACEAIALAHGPGSYSGIRVGLAAARGFALAHSIPIYGVTSLYNIAYALKRAGNPNPFMAVMETKRKDFYWQLFDHDLAPLCEAKAEDCQKIIQSLILYATHHKISIAGDAAERLLKQMEEETDYPYHENIIRNPDILYPDPADLAYLVTLGKAIKNPQPLYLRPADTTARKR